MEVFEIVFAVIGGMIGGGLTGALLGLAPFFIGKCSGKPNLGKLGFFWSLGLGASLVGAPFVFPTVIGFVIAILVKESDYFPPDKVMPPQNYYDGYNPAPAPVAPTRMAVTCLAGPLKGQTYGIGHRGLIIGRDNDCTIRLPNGVPGVSRHHCSLRWQGGALMLTDLNSTHGTYMADGRKLPPQFPTQMAAGQRFYLANGSNLFQIVLTG